MKHIVTAKEGFYFNEETKKLESYELVKVEFTLAEDSPTYYHCKLGGVDKIIETDHLVLFENEVAFECGNFIRSTEARYLPAIGRALPWNNGLTWAFVDGMAKQVDATTIGLTYEDYTVRVTSGEKYYSCKSEVYKWHDYVVKEANGSERTVVSPATLIGLTDEHKKLVSEWEGLAKKMVEAGLEFLYCAESGLIKVFHRNKNADIEVDYTDLSMDGFTSCHDVAYRTDVGAIYLGCDDDIWVKSK
jgi:hypothetical protein